MLVNRRARAAFDEKFPSVFIINPAQLGGPLIQVRLISGNVIYVGSLATKLDARIGSRISGNSELESQFEVGDVSIFPNKPMVFFQSLSLRNFADDRSVLDAPIIGRAFLAVQGFAIENVQKHPIVALHIR